MVSCRCLDRHWACRHGLDPNDFSEGELKQLRALFRVPSRECGLSEEDFVAFVMGE